MKLKTAIHLNKLPASTGSGGTVDKMDKLVELALLPKRKWQHVWSSIRWYEHLQTMINHYKPTRLQFTRKIFEPAFESFVQIILRRFQCWVCNTATHLAETAPRSSLRVYARDRWDLHPQLCASWHILAIPGVSWSENGVPPFLGNFQRDSKYMKVCENMIYIYIHIYIYI